LGKLTLSLFHASRYEISDDWGKALKIASENGWNEGTAGTGKHLRNTDPPLKPTS